MQRTVRNTNDGKLGAVTSCSLWISSQRLPEAPTSIYTLLSGKALEAIEHLEVGDYQKEGGDQVLWSLLDARLPQKEKVNEAW